MFNTQQCGGNFSFQSLTQTPNIAFAHSNQNIENSVLQNPSPSIICPSPQEIAYFGFGIQSKTKAFIAAVAMIMLLGCANSQKQALAPQNQGSKSPFGDTYAPVCEAYDDEDWFAAVGIANGPASRMDVLQLAALTNAQNVVRRKMQHAYEGVIRDYAKYIGNDQGTSADASLRSAGDQIIDILLDNTNTVCGPRFTSVDAKGHVNAFTGIKISKKAASQKMADKIESLVSKDEKIRIEFEEKKYREDIEAKIREYKESR